MTLKLQRAPRRSAAVVVLALLVSVLAVIDVGSLASSARAADSSSPSYISASGGSRVTVGGVVRSDLTAASYLRVKEPGRSSENQVASLNVLDGVLTATGVTTRQRTTRLLAGGTRITSEAKITGVSLLGGAITADAIETKASATLDDNGVTRTGGTKFVGLRVRDNKLALNVAKNTTVKIPGLATVVLNEVRGQLGGDALIKSVATGIKITLLSSYGELGRGARIEITPTSAKIELPVPIDGVPLFGAAFSTRTVITMNNAVKFQAGPTSAMVMPAAATNDIELTNSTAKVYVPGLLTAYGLSASAQGTVTSTASQGTMTARVGDVSVLDGAISVDAIKATASLSLVDGSPLTTNATSELVGLTINGRSYPVTVAPNTVVEIPGLVKVIINEQTRQTFPFNGIGVRALHIIALPGAPDDVAGLDMQLGGAAIWVNAG